MGEAAEEIALVSELRSALAAGGIELVYQPQVRLHGRRDVRFEALARWTRGAAAISPGRFIPLAERSGLIHALTRYVLERAIRQLAEWRKTQASELTVAVNISGRDLADPELPAVVGDLLTRYGVPAEDLALEITESALVADIDRCIPRLNALRALGVTLALDDFGSGYSSLRYLGGLPVSELKIDRSFVRRMGRDTGARAIVRATISLAHDLGLAVVAEGVETEAEIAALRSLDCDLVQGFVVAQPLAAREVRSWIGAMRTPKPQQLIAVSA